MTVSLIQWPGDSTFSMLRFVAIWLSVWYVWLGHHLTVSLICWALSSFDCQSDIRPIARGGSRGSIEPPKLGLNLIIACKIYVKRKSWFNRTRNRVYSLLFGPLHAVILTPSKVVCYFRIVSSTADLITLQPSHARQIRPTMVMNIHLFFSHVLHTCI